MLTLFKYEVRKTLSLKIAVIVLTFVMEAIFLIGFLSGKGTNFQNDGSYVGFLMAGTIGLMFCGLLGPQLWALQSIQLLYRELNSKQSYMLFMTPNSSYSILGAKFLESMLSAVAGGLFFIALAAVDVLLLVVNTAGIPGEAYRMLRLELASEGLTANAALSAALGILVWWISVIAAAFFSVVLQAAIMNGKRFGALISFAFFVAVSVLWGYLKGFVLPHGNGLSGLLLFIGFDVVIVIALYLSAGWIMDRKLSV
ncbi:hypothetical protein [Lachnoclostridium sp. Marseille-P6806]|uniref:hypothetical protein n=1 Tax=Lachnoclostridium sp. Marseille-P6806 TaxID=2364793 RepID=UPI001031DA24|nr:hypothetical protein [Lachnoclostridium sp. Marseille-P6806]